MQSIISRTGVKVSYRISGCGPRLVLIHGGFSQFVLPKLEEHFTVAAVARRGRGDTAATIGHTLEDEAVDAVAIIESLGGPVFLLGHSYGAHVALRAAALAPRSVRKLVLYEAPWPSVIRKEVLAKLELLGEAGDWDQFAWDFFRRVLSVPAGELARLRANGLWTPIVADAKASLGDLRALTRSRFEPEQYRSLNIPTLLQTGAESPPDLYVTGALAEVLPNVKIESLPGQAHEAMTTAPQAYAQSVIRFLLDGETANPSKTLLRAVRPTDAARLESIRKAAFAPVFASFRALLGPDIYELVQAREDNAQAGLLASWLLPDSGWEVYVAESAPVVVGFVCIRMNQAARTGEIGLNAVHPTHSGQGIGTSMYRFALARMREAGMRAAAVSTGGDASHAAARRAYAKAGFSAEVPSVWMCCRL